MKELIIIGANLDAIELCQKLDYRIVGIIDNKITNLYYGYPVLGNDILAEDILNMPKYRNCEISIISDSPNVRYKLYNYYSTFRSQVVNLISKDTVISKFVKSIGEGVFINDGVRLMQNVVISDFVRINRSVHFAHDGTVGSFSTISPHAVILGDVQIGSFTYIGANATILPHLKIGSHCTIGAGAVVTKDVPDNVVVVGNPARVLKEKHK